MCFTALSQVNKCRLQIHKAAAISFVLVITLENADVFVLFGGQRSKNNSGLSSLASKMNLESLKQIQSRKV